jgi:branched-chain amino acid transport system substrate-binding protein
MSNGTMLARPGNARPGKTIGRRSLVAGAVGTAALAASGRARAAEAVKLGVLGDMSGPYQAASGPGAVLAARMAAQDIGGSVLGMPIEVIQGDTQNKPDVASGIAGQWYDREGVDLILDLPVTPVGLAVQKAAVQHQRSVIITGAAITEFTSKLCSPYSSHWADDVHAMAGAASAIAAGGGREWFFITVDFSFGTALQQAATTVLESSGGKVVGSARFPLGNTDFSSQLVSAQASGAKVIGLAAVGDDLVNLIKQAHEFGMVKQGKGLATFLVYITDIAALGLEVAQGLSFVSGYYWDRDAGSRAFAQRFFAAHKAMPTREQAYIYAGALHFLKAMKAAGTRDAAKLGEVMRATPVDLFGTQADLRADGRLIHDLDLYTVKAPGQSKAPWDFYARSRVLPADEAFLPANPACKA